MDGDYDYLRLFLLYYLIHFILDKWYQRLEFHTAEKTFVKPFFHIRISKANNAHLKSIFFDTGIFLKIWFGIVCPNGIGSQERYTFVFQIGSHSVIYMMPSLDIVIANSYRVILHILCKFCIQMLGGSIDIIVIIRGIIALEAIACINKYHVVFSCCIPNTIHIIFDSI